MIVEVRNVKCPNCGNELDSKKGLRCLKCKKRYVLQESLPKVKDPATFLYLLRHGNVG